MSSLLCTHFHFAVSFTVESAHVLIGLPLLGSDFCLQNQMRTVKTESCELIDNCHELLQLGTRDVQKEVWLVISCNLQSLPLPVQAYTTLCDTLIVFSRRIRTTSQYVAYCMFVMLSFAP